MTIEQCYQRLNGDFAQAVRRMSGTALVERLVVKFLNDGTFPDLCKAMDSGSAEKAFQAAHTLKGVTANMGFSQLQASAGQLTEALRGISGSIPPAAIAAMEQVKGDYQMTVEAIRAFQSEKG